MSARRFFLEDIHESGELVRIAGSDAHKIVNVLRLRSGDRVEVVDSAARAFTASLEIDGAVVQARLADEVSRRDGDEVRIDVAQAIPKGAKMDFVVEKLTELGVATLLPVESERSVVRDTGASRLERWRRLARTAAQQCGRDTLPTVEAPLEFDALLACFAQYDTVLFPWELASREPLRAVLPGYLEGVRRLLIVVGPEGGFAHGEAERAERAGARLISLGARILRSETAALVLVSIVRFVTGDSQPDAE